MRQNSINIVPCSGPTRDDRRMALLRNKSRPGSRIRPTATGVSSPSGGSSSPTSPSTSTHGAYQLTSTCPVQGRPDRTQFHWLQYSLDEAKFKQRNNVWLNEQVDAEDIEAISLVNKGARSGFAPRGRF